ncbi:hypothetical protein BK816_07375 [Boudabousia tangfeifanii]|uniref:ABC transporter domain-containing protein n=1 Tax=Boudabousia tangfeifanii TaxID=1912795 RepID=A0A1D9MMK2_9ACTO|nr:hypothetical protein BK816_07375 [Boudabousia tangfeifanii]
MLQALALQVRFNGGPKVVDGVELNLSHGKVTALVGESGSGKSVSARAIMGLLPPSANVKGSAVLSGRGDNPNLQLVGAGRKILNEVRGARIAMVFQEPTTALNPLMKVGAQIDEIILLHEDVSRSKAKARSLELLGEVSINEPERVYNSYPHQLSGGQLQRACIAMAIACRPCVVIADEPTTALDMVVQAQILDLLRDLTKKRNLGVLLITHDMGVVADIADEVVVLRHGQIVEHGEVEQIFYHPTQDYTKQLLASVPTLGRELVVPQIGRSDVSEQKAAQAVKDLLEPLPLKRAEDVPAADPNAAPKVAVKIRDLVVEFGAGKKRKRAVDNVSFDLYAGEILALVGQSGSGKSTISSTIYGQVKPTAGTVELTGENICSVSRRKRQALLSQLGVVFQNPASSLNPRRTVLQSVAEPLRLHTTMNRAEREARALSALVAARLEPELANRYPHELSGGQRQRVAIARAIVLRPQLVIADEPTSALDVSVQAQVLVTLAQLQKEMGFAALLITHDLAVVEQLASRTVVLNSGKIVESGPTADVLGNPQTEYTRRLINAVPVADPREQAQRREQR